MSRIVLLCCVVQRFILRKLPPFFARNQNFPLKPDKMSGHSFSKKSMTIISTRKVHTYRSVPSSKFMWRAVSILLSKIQPRGPAWASLCHRPVYHLQFPASIPSPLSPVCRLTQRTAHSTDRPITNRLLLPSASTAGQGVQAGCFTILLSCQLWLRWASSNSEKVRQRGIQTLHCIVVIYLRYLHFLRLVL